MARSQFRSKRSVSGKKYVALRKKRASELAGAPALTHIGVNRLKVKRVMGGNSKKALLRGDVVYVANGAKTTKLAIQSVVNNPANINYTRRNIITKGCIVKTEKGDVKITSRPGQEGVLQGVLVNN
ncbi:MAG: 30S ribosomal protein S8e [Nanoarchaeota archaeon]